MDQGKTVFFSTHILADAEMLCDRVAIVVKGSVRQEGSLSQLLGANLERIDIVFEVPENFDRSVLAAFGLQLRQVGHQFVATPSSHEQADAWALTILQAGGRLISITPHRQTLEDIFLQDAGGPADQVRS